MVSDDEDDVNIIEEEKDVKSIASNNDAVTFNMKFIRAMISLELSCNLKAMKVIAESINKANDPEARRDMEALVMQSLSKFGLKLVS